MPSEKMNIVLAANEAYTQHLAATMCSILCNCKSKDEFKFFILSDDISEKSKRKILQLKKIKDFEIEFITIKLQDFSDCPERVHLKVQTYFRLKMAEMIKESKVLYLDCDIIVRKSLSQLYNTDVSDYCAVVVEDISQGKESGNNRLMTLIDTNNYFNAGVMLWNLDKVRENDIFGKCFEFIAQNPEKILYCDQDAINVVIQNDIKYADKVFNFQYSPYFENIEQVYKTSAKEIFIIHFVTELKPWTHKLPIGFVFEYYKYVFLSPWRETVCISIIMNLIRKLKLTLKYI